MLLEAEDTQVEFGIDCRAKRMKEEEQKPHRFSSSLVENRILECRKMDESEVKARLCPCL